jgi:hypothetical protein
MQLGASGQFLLRNPKFLSQGTHTLPDLSPQPAPHSAYRAEPRKNGLHTIVFIDSTR